jgi:N-dimethylarginine dimethylaminohydrolase
MGIVHLDHHFTIVASGTAAIRREVVSGDQIARFDARFALIDVTDEEDRAVRVNVLAIAPGIVGAARGGDCTSAAMAPTGSTCLLSTTPR